MPHFNNATNQFFNANGKPLSGGKLHFYDVGTLDAKNTYSDFAETSANANPVVLDSEGRHTEIYYTDQARVILKNSADVEIWDTDYVEDATGEDQNQDVFVQYNGNTSTDLALAKSFGSDGLTIQDTGIFVDAQDNVYGQAQAARTVTDTDTSVLADKGKTIYLNAATAKTFTIDSNANVAYTLNTRIEFINIGAGTWTVAITDDTLNSPGSFVDLVQYQSAVATKYGTTTWVLNGGLS